MTSYGALPPNLDSVERRLEYCPLRSSRAEKLPAETLLAILRLASLPRVQHVKWLPHGKSAAQREELDETSLF